MMYLSQNITCYLLHNLECLWHFSSSWEPLEGPVGHEGIRGRRGHPPCGTRPSVRAGGNWSQVGSQVQSAWKIEILQSQRNHITRLTKKSADKCSQIEENPQCDHCDGDFLRGRSLSPGIVMSRRLVLCLVVHLDNLCNTLDGFHNAQPRPT